MLFPGQGSQYVGMGAELFDARPDLLTGVADRVLGWSLREVCLTGPEELLTSTDRAQPSLYALAFALWMELAERVGHPPIAAAGHSLGEYTALAASGAFSFDEGLRLVAARATAMAEAVRQAPSGMAAVLGAAEDKAEEVAAARRAEGGRLWVANLNAPGQVVLGGGLEDIDWLVGHGRRLGIRRVVKLNVAGAFHTPLMASAVPRLSGALEQIEMKIPAFRVWANVTATPFDTDQARRLLGRQVVAPVLFGASLRAMHEAGAEVFVHVGPGDVTAGLARRAVRGCRVLVVSSISQAEEAAAVLGS
ncbi:MAG: ACP S-malonyltransferase [bacterium]|nr:ACP S-malonyltransferase [bacterium]MDE0287369.1 ACP S-malonyltransferase [bacterium]MDE0439188.1 ACP S-malonyltransferase [bacterium]